jgi:pimeloyl-ACP methyl ester carboxylesterase
MGGMIAMKAAAMAPQRVCSLTVVSSTEGGWQSVPSTWRAVRLAWRALHAKTPVDRAKVDLKFHFMRKTLLERVRARADVDRARCWGERLWLRMVLRRKGIR